MGFRRDRTVIRRSAALILVTLIACGWAAGIVARTRVPVNSARTELFASVGAAGADPPARTVQSPSAPVAPKPALYLALAVLIGLVLGFPAAAPGGVSDDPGRAALVGTLARRATAAATRAGRAVFELVASTRSDGRRIVSPVAAVTPKLEAGRPRTQSPLQPTGDRGG